MSRTDENDSICDECGESCSEDGGDDCPKCGLWICHECRLAHICEQEAQ